MDYEDFCDNCGKKETDCWLLHFCDGCQKGKTGKGGFCPDCRVSDWDEDTDICDDCAGVNAVPSGPKICCICGIHNCFSPSWSTHKWLIVSCGSHQEGAASWLCESTPCHKIYFNKIDLNISS